MSKKIQNAKLFFSMTLEYLDTYLPKQLGRSPQTIRSYRNSLSSFHKYLYEERKLSITKFEFSECNRDILLDYVSFLKEKGNSPTTCNVRLAAIKSYMQFAAENDIALQSVALRVLKVPFSKVPKKEKTLLSNEALATLFAQPQNTKLGVRDRAIMILLYDSAIRVSELTGLRLGDLNLETGLSIHVRGKGNKERSVAITQKTTEHLRIYKNLYHKDSDDRNQWFFYTTINGKSDRISTGTIERILNKYADEARAICPEMPDRVYPHLLRAERATHLYRDGVDSILISKILGHASVDTTKIYALPSMEMIREALDKVKLPVDTAEEPIWTNNEDELAKLCGLR